MPYTYYVESEAQVTVITTITSDTPLDAGHIQDIVNTGEYAPPNTTINPQSNFLITDGVLSISGDLEVDDLR